MAWVALLEEVRGTIGLYRASYCTGSGSKGCSSERAAPGGFGFNLALAAEVGEFLDAEALQHAFLFLLHLLLLVFPFVVGVEGRPLGPTTWPRGSLALSSTARPPEGPRNRTTLGEVLTRARN